MRGRDTQTEMVLCRFLDAAKIEYEAHPPQFPGSPEVVVRASHVVFFIHGCHWHARGCRRMKTRKNRSFWKKKFGERNQHDLKAIEQLRGAGWTVIQVWECQVTSRSLRARILQAAAPSLRICKDCGVIVWQGSVLCRGCLDQYARRQRGADVVPKVRQKRIPEDSAKDRRIRRRALHLCGVCGMPARDGYRSCPTHGVYPAQTGARHYHKLAEQGLCRCRQPVAPGKKRCLNCLQDARTAAKERHQRYKRENRCVQCKRPRYEGTSWCKDHLYKVRAYVAAKKQRLRTTQEPNDEQQAV